MVSQETECLVLCTQNIFKRISFTALFGSFFGGVASAQLWRPMVSVKFASCMSDICLLGDGAVLWSLSWKLAGVRLESEDWNTFGIKIATRLGGSTAPDNPYNAAHVFSREQHPPAVICLVSEVFFGFFDPVAAWVTMHSPICVWRMPALQNMQKRYDAMLRCSDTLAFRWVSASAPCFGSPCRCQEAP